MLATSSSVKSNSKALLPTPPKYAMLKLCFDIYKDECIQFYPNEHTQSFELTHMRFNEEMKLNHMSFKGTITKTDSGIYISASGFLSFGQNKNNFMCDMFCYKDTTRVEITNIRALTPFKPFEICKTVWYHAMMGGLPAFTDMKQLKMALYDAHGDRLVGYILQNLAPFHVYKSKPINMFKFDEESIDIKYTIGACELNVRTLTIFVGTQTNTRFIVKNTYTGIATSDVIILKDPETIFKRNWHFYSTDGICDPIVEAFLNGKVHI